MSLCWRSPSVSPVFWRLSMGKAFRYLMIFIFLILGAFAAIFSVLGFVNGQFFGGFMLLAQTASFAIALWHLMFCQGCKVNRAAPSANRKGRYSWFGGDV